jgi:hypothetical protein
MPRYTQLGLVGAAMMIVYFIGLGVWKLVTYAASLVGR